ncbi:MAG TPA: alpha/beta fold hydrolase [Steroidobacteraceae bacterium]|nr:alpha/beta fold hydrolase [Steroidobacteraceae bacterium]
MNKQSAARCARYLLPGILMLQALVWAAAVEPLPAGPAATLSVGALTLHRCETPAPWCAVLMRPLDPRGTVAGTLPVYFEYYPHTAPGAVAGTLVATEGGPGYPATASRAEYLALFAPLRARYDVVIMDNRGTGRSGAIDCRELQDAAALTESNIGACGRSLGPAAPFYGTALATDDLAAILEGLGTGPVGLYGDSYGSYFAQVFALRHAQLLRTLVLDGADPLDGPDFPWYPHYATAMREKFNLACARSRACSALPGSSLDHIAPALERLRAQPFQATVRSGAGHLSFTANASALAIVMFGGSPAFATVREVDAAARAFVHDDRAPLLRLMAEALGSVDSRDATRNPRLFSAGLAAAVSCQDPPQIFDMHLPPAARLAARASLIAGRRAAFPAAYAPFTIDEYRGMPLDYAFIDQCVAWPSPPAWPPAPLIYAASSYPDVPVLVLSGELDNMTSVADGAVAAGHFRHARHVVIANSFHVNALPHARSDCGATLVRRFMDTRSTGDESCAAAVPPVRLVPVFARRVRELAPAQGSAASHASDEDLRVVTAALLTAEDAIARAVADGPGTGVGLRGGSFVATAADGGYLVKLHALRWTEDVSASGSISWPGRSGLVRAHLGLETPAGPATLDLSWPEGASGARAMAHGLVGGRSVTAGAPAP